MQTPPTPVSSVRDHTINRHMTSTPRDSSRQIAESAYQRNMQYERQESPIQDPREAYGAYTVPDLLNRNPQATWSQTGYGAPTRPAHEQTEIDQEIAQMYAAHDRACALEAAQHDVDMMSEDEAREMAMELSGGSITFEEDNDSDIEEIYNPNLDKDAETWSLTSTTSATSDNWDYSDLHDSTYMSYEDYNHNSDPTDYATPPAFASTQITREEYDTVVAAPIGTPQCFVSSHDREGKAMIWEMREFTRHPSYLTFVYRKQTCTPMPYDHACAYQSAVAPENVQQITYDGITWQLNSFRERSIDYTIWISHEYQQARIYATITAAPTYFVLEKAFIAERTNINQQQYCCDLLCLEAPDAQIDGRLDCGCSAWCTCACITRIAQSIPEPEHIEETIEEIIADLEKEENDCSNEKTTADHKIARAHNRHVPSAENLENAGLHYRQTTDHFYCPKCRIIIGYWEQHDDALADHQKHSPDCKDLEIRINAVTKKLPKKQPLQVTELKTLTTLKNNTIFRTVVNIPAEAEDASPMHFQCKLSESLQAEIARIQAIDNPVTKALAVRNVQDLVKPHQTKTKLNVRFDKPATLTMHAHITRRRADAAAKRALRKAMLQKLEQFQQRTPRTADWDIKTETYYTDNYKPALLDSLKVGRRINFTPNAKASEVYWSPDQWQTFAKLLVQFDADIEAEMTRLGHHPEPTHFACSDDDNFIMQQCKNIVKKVTGITDKLQCIAIGMTLASAVLSIIAAAKAANRTSRWSSILSAICSLVSVACMIASGIQIKKMTDKLSETIPGLVKTCTDKLQRLYARLEQDAEETPDEDVMNVIQYSVPDVSSNYYGYLDDLTNMQFYSLVLYPDSLAAFNNAVKDFPLAKRTAPCVRPSWVLTPPPAYSTDEWRTILALLAPVIPQGPSRRRMRAESDTPPSSLESVTTMSPTQTPQDEASNMSPCNFQPPPPIPPAPMATPNNITRTFAEATKENNFVEAAQEYKDLLARQAEIDAALKEEDEEQVDEASAITNMCQTVYNKAFKREPAKGRTHICTSKCFDRPGSGKIDWRPYGNLQQLLSILYAEELPEHPFQEIDDLEKMGFKILKVDEHQTRDTNCPNFIMLTKTHVGLPNAYTEKVLQYGVCPQYFWPYMFSSAAGFMTGTRVYESNKISYIPYSVDILPHLRNGEMNNNRCKPTFKGDTYVSDDKEIQWNVELTGKPQIRHHTATGEAAYVAYPANHTELKRHRPLSKKAHHQACANEDFLDQMLNEKIEFNDSSSVIKLCTGLLSVMGVSTYMGVSDDIDPLRVCQLVNQASTAKHNIDSAIEWISNAVTNSTEENLWADKFNAIKRKYDVLNAIPPSHVNTRPEFVYSIKNVQDEILSFVANLGKQKNTAEIQFYARQCNVMTSELDKKYKEVLEGRESSSSRVPTIFVQICGGMGLGKSSAVQAGGAIVRDLNTILGLDPDTPPHQIIVDNNGYYNTYAGQAIGVKDEAFRLGDRDPFIQEINALASPAAHTLSGAFIKHQPAAYRIVLLVSNLMHVNIRDFSPEVKDAFWSRILRYRVSSPFIEAQVRHYGRHVVVDRDPRKWQWARYTCDGEGQNRVEQTIDYVNFVHDVHAEVMKLDIRYGKFKPLSTMARSIKRELKTQVVQVAPLPRDFATRRFARPHADEMPVDQREDQQRVVTQACAGDMEVGGHNHCVIHIYGSPGMGKTTYVKNHLVNQWKYYDKNATVHRIDQRMRVPEGVKERDVLLIEDLLLHHQEAYQELYNNLPCSCIILITSNIKVSQPPGWLNTIRTLVGNRRVYLDEIKTPGLLRRIGFHGDVFGQEGHVNVSEVPNLCAEMYSRLKFVDLLGRHYSPGQFTGKIMEHVATWASTNLTDPMVREVVDIDAEFEYDVRITADSVDHLKRILYDNGSIRANLGTERDKAIYLNPLKVRDFLDQGNFCCEPWHLPENDNIDMLTLATNLYATLKQFRPQTTVLVKVGTYVGSVKTPGVMEVKMQLENVTLTKEERDQGGEQKPGYVLKNAGAELFYFTMSQIETGVGKGWAHVAMPVDVYSVVVKHKELFEAIPGVLDRLVEQQRENEAKAQSAYRQARIDYLKKQIADHPILFSLACLCLMGWLISVLAMGVRFVAGWFSSTDVTIYDPHGNLLPQPPSGMKCTKCSSLLEPEIRMTYATGVARKRLFSVVCQQCHEYADACPGSGDITGYLKQGLRKNNAIITDSDLEWLKSKLHNTACATMSTSDREQKPQRSVFLPNGQIVSKDSVQEWSSDLFMACSNEDELLNVSDKIRKNFVKVHCGGMTVHGIGMQGRLVATVGHIFFKTKAKPYVVVNKEGVDTWLPATLRRQYTDRDLAFVTIDDKTFGDFKSIVRHVATNKDINQIRNVALVDYREEHTKFLCTTALFGHKESIPVMNMDVGSRGTMQIDQYIALNNFTVQASYAKRGMCGHPLLAQPNKDVESRLLCGMFNSAAYDQVDLTCTILSKEVVVDVLRNIEFDSKSRVECVQVRMPTGDTPYFTAYELKLFEKIVETPLNDQVVSEELDYLGAIPNKEASKCKLHKTPYYDLINSHRECDVGIVPKVAPDVPEVVKNNQGKPCYFSTELSKIVTHDTQDRKIKRAVNKYVAQLYEDVYGTYQTLNTFKVLNGANNISKTKKSTSPGPSVCNMHPKAVNKGYFYETIDDITKWKDNPEANAMLNREIFIMNQWKEGKSFLFVTKASIKEELLPLAKLAKGKARLFGASDQTLVNLEKRVMGGFLGKAVEVPSHVVVGLDQKYDFHRMRHIFRSFPKVLNVDQKAFDKHTSQRDVQDALRIILSLNTTIDNEENSAEVVNAIVETLTNYIYLADGQLYHVRSGLNSGQYCTNIAGSTISIVRGYYGIAKAYMTEFGLDRYDAIRRLKQYFVMACGDDIVIMSKALCPPTASVIVSCMEDSGVTMQSPSKTGTNHYEWTLYPETPIEFCGRYITESEGYVIAPVRETAIWKSLYFSRDLSRENLILQLGTALEELYLHQDRDLYNKWRGVFHQCQKKLGKYSSLPTWEDARLNFIYKHHPDQKSLAAIESNDSNSAKLEQALDQQERIVKQFTANYITKTHEAKGLEMRGNQQYEKLCEIAEETPEVWLPNPSGFEYQGSPAILPKIAAGSWANSNLHPEPVNGPRLQGLTNKISNLTHLCDSDPTYLDLLIEDTDSLTDSKRWNILHNWGVEVQAKRVGSKVLIDWKAVSGHPVAFCFRGSVQGCTKNEALRLCYPSIMGALVVCDNLGSNPHTSTDYKALFRNVACGLEEDLPPLEAPPADAREIYMGKLSDIPGYDELLYALTYQCNRINDLIPEFTQEQKVDHLLMCVDKFKDMLRRSEHKRNCIQKLVDLPMLVVADIFELWGINTKIGGPDDFRDLRCNECAVEYPNCDCDGNDDPTPAILRKDHYACADNEVTGGSSVSDSSAIPNSSDTFVSTNMQQDAGTFSLQGGMLPFDILKGGLHKNILDLADQDFLIVTKPVPQSTAAGDNLLKIAITDLIKEHPFSRMMLKHSQRVSGNIIVTLISTMSQLNQGGLIGYMTHPTADGVPAALTDMEKQFYQHDIRAVTQGIATRYQLPLVSKAQNYYWTSEIIDGSIEAQPEFRIDALTAVYNATSAAGDTAGILYIHVNVANLVYAGINEPEPLTADPAQAVNFTTHDKAVDVTDVVGGLTTVCLTGRSEMLHNGAYYGHKLDFKNNYVLSNQYIPYGFKPNTWDQLEVGAYISATENNVKGRTITTTPKNLIDLSIDEQFHTVYGAAQNKFNATKICQGTRSNSGGSFTYFLFGGEGYGEFYRKEGADPHYTQSGENVTEVAHNKLEWTTPLNTVGETFNIGDGLPETWTNVTLKGDPWHINAGSATNTNIGDDAQLRFFKYIQRKYNPLPGSIWSFSLISKRYNTPVVQCVLYTGETILDWRVYTRTNNTEVCRSFDEGLLVSTLTEQKTAYTPPMTDTLNWTSTRYSADGLSTRFQAAEQWEKLKQALNLKQGRKLNNMACSIFGGMMSGAGNALSQRKRHKFDMEDQDNMARNMGNLSKQGFEQNQQLSAQIYQQQMNLNQGLYQNQQTITGMQQTGANERANIASQTARGVAQTQAGASVHGIELQQQGANERQASSQNFAREMRGISQQNSVPSNAAGESMGGAGGLSRVAEEAAAAV